MPVGIETINFYGGRMFVDIRSLFDARGLDTRRFDNLMLKRKSVPLPCEDPVSCGVNAAAPLLETLTPAEKKSIELVITATESGLDFGKSLSTYFHQLLGLNENCRLFELKQACYGGTAALQMAMSWIASGAAPGARALVIATDMSKAAIRGSYVEPSQGIGAVAMLVSDKADVLEIDFGANGYFGAEIMDSCRPTPEIETGDSDLSLLGYLDSLEKAFLNYAEKVEGADFTETFAALAFHTPFPGMVKGAHRMLMRKLKQSTPAISDTDFETRVTPSLQYCMEVGNIYSATLYLALCSLIENTPLTAPRRIGLYSYGSGSCAEFFSGIITAGSRRKIEPFCQRQRLEDRLELSFQQYDSLLDASMEWGFGLRDKERDISGYQALYEQAFAGRGLLVLSRIKDYHREYEWS
jgi:polyketide biosynthesis 3-hydroxy-3-methylglutaryl-CoA synthase-like enzyme PksG